MQGEYQEEEEGKERGGKAARDVRKGAGKELGKVTGRPCRAWVTKAWHRWISGKAVSKEGAEESSRLSNQS